MATIKQIAELSKASIATVSKVLNGKSGVSECTKYAVLNAAKQLNYRPNLNARNLKTGKSRTVGIITEDLTVFNSPDIVDGIAAACEEAGYHYLLSNMRFYKRYGHREPGQKESALLVHNAVNDLLSKQVDGIIYVGCHSHVVISLDEYPDTKFVCAYCISQDPKIPSVLYDDESAAYELTKLLLEQGDTKIGMITGPADSGHTAFRSRGHLQALFDSGIPYNPALTVEGNWERESGLRLAGSLIQQGVTAIFAHNDLMAMGVLNYCTAHGIEVGKDLRVFGFDNRDITAVCQPPIATVALPLFSIGKTAAENLLNILAGNEPEQCIIKLPCTVVDRASGIKPE